MTILVEMLNEIVTRAVTAVSRDDTVMGSLTTRQRGIRSQQRLVRLLEEGVPVAAEEHWRAHMAVVAKVVLGHGAVQPAGRRCRPRRSEPCRLAVIGRRRLAEVGYRRMSDSRRRSRCRYRAVFSIGVAIVERIACAALRETRSWPATISGRRGGDAGDRDLTRRHGSVPAAP